MSHATTPRANSASVINHKQTILKVEGMKYLESNNGKAVTLVATTTHKERKSEKARSHSGKHMCALHEEHATEEEVKQCNEYNNARALENYHLHLTDQVVKAGTIP